jgi:protein-tyrosine phosphatase
VRRERVAIFVGERKIEVTALNFAKDARFRTGDAGPVNRIRRRAMDITWVTERIAVGGGIWNAENMAAVAQQGITHIIDMQIEFDDTPLAGEYGIEVLWNPTDDDFEPKPAELFRRGVKFAAKALEDGDGKLFVHCAAGVHRAPTMTLALLGSMGWELEDAMELIQKKRPVADFADVYVRSVERFLEGSDFTTEVTGGHRGES